MPAASPAELRRGRRGRTDVTATMAARATGPARPHSRTPGPRDRHHRWTTRPAGAHARGNRCAREDDHPGSRRRAVEVLRTARPPHSMAVVMVMPGDRGAGEEDDRHHENNAGDDHHPGRGLVEPRMPGKRRRRRRRASGRQLDRGFGCLGHPSIMPRCEPAIKHPVLAAEEPGETQNDRGNEQDSRNDRHPSRYLVKPLRMCHRRRRSGRRRNRRLSCLAHTSHNASRQWRRQSSEPGAPLRGAGLLTVVILGCFRVVALPRKTFTRKGLPQGPLGVRRSQGRSDGLRRLRGSQAGGTALAARPGTMVHALLAHGVGVPVVVAAVVMVARNLEAGEENCRDDEHDPGDDHDPRCEPVEPIRFDWLSRWRAGDRSRRGWCFRCFTHAEMMRAKQIGCARCNL